VGKLMESDKRMQKEKEKLDKIFKEVKNESSTS
jgi:hypothetical protein